MFPLLKKTTSLFFGLAIVLSTQGFCNEVNKTGILYKIKKPGIGLTFIAKGIYGKARYWKQIAEWNNVKAPYTLQLGSTLVLKKPITFPESEIEQKVMSYWNDWVKNRKVAKKHVTTKIPSTTKIASVYNERATLKAGTAEVKRGSPMNAIKIYKKALNQPNASPEISYQLGQTYMKVKNPKAALHYFHKSRNDNPRNIAAWFKEMETLRELGRLNEERVTALQLLKQYPSLRKVAYLKKFQGNAH